MIGGPESRWRKRLANPWVGMVLLGAAYYAGGRIGILFAISDTSLSVFWPPNSITLAALLLAPRRWWPHLVVGSWIGDMVVELSSSSPPESLVIAFTNAAQTLGCAAVMRKFSWNPIAHPHQYAFLVIAYLGVAAPAGAAAVALYLTEVSGTAGSFWPLWTSWWLGDGLSIICLTPLVLAAFEPPDGASRRYARRNEAALLAMAVAGTVYFDLFVFFPRTHGLSNLILPPLLWAGFRFGVGGAALAGATAVVGAAASSLTLAGHQGNETIGELVLTLQTLLLGNVISAVLLATVVRGWHQAERTMSLALASADVANRAKSEILANMSHELRTPLNAVIGFSDAMTKQLFGSLSPKYQEYASDILSSGQYLLELINDILDVSAIESGKVELNDDDIDIPGLCETAMRLVRVRADTRKVALNCTLPPLPTLRADRRRVQQILLNLLTNAIKFTPSGGRVRLEAWVEPSGAVTMAVSDTGIGMDPAGIVRALTRFGQIDAALARSEHGIGLGLPLTVDLVEMHDGRLVIDSTPGRGTTVQVFWPAERSGAMPTPTPPRRAD
jgi:signal transduction histidine kinase